MVRVNGHVWEVRRHSDRCLHLYRPEQIDAGKEYLTPACAEFAPFYATDHPRWLTIPTWRGEIHPACLAAVLGEAIADPRWEQSLEDTQVFPVLPALAGSIRGELPAFSARGRDHEGTPSARDFNEPEFSQVADGAANRHPRDLVGLGQLEFVGQSTARGAGLDVAPEIISHLLPQQPGAVMVYTPGPIHPRHGPTLNVR